MAIDPSETYARSTRSDWLRVHTLITLRWLAIGGQVMAILVAVRGFGLVLPLAMCSLAVGVAILANVLAGAIFPANRRLSETEAFLALLFDLLQLALLLFLTGGLTNPFSLLILAPVMVSASALQLRPTLILGGLAILSVSLSAFVNLPLRAQDGSPLTMPPIFLFGSWAAIVIGIVFLSIYARRIATEMHLMSDALLATQMALAREQKLTDIGGVVAAAAHELGTPLATIKLVASELLDETRGNPALEEDLRLIRDQTDRCRDILRGMGKAGKRDTMTQSAPVETVLREAADPHQDRGKALIFHCGPAEAGAEDPLQIRRSPEVIHGLRNLVQNAVDYSASRVWIEAGWSASTFWVRITDDGDGFPPHLLGRLGDPFLRSVGSSEASEDPRRPGYEGMGLGLFIAKTLLERTGATVKFANAADPFLRPGEAGARRGAVVRVSWPIEEIQGWASGAIGQNMAM